MVRRGKGGIGELSEWKGTNHGDLIAVGELERGDDTVKLLG